MNSKKDELPPESEFIELSLLIENFIEKNNWSLKGIVSFLSVSIVVFMEGSGQNEEAMLENLARMMEGFKERRKRHDEKPS